MTKFGIVVTVVALSVCPAVVLAGPSSVDGQSVAGAVQLVPAPAHIAADVERAVELLGQAEKMAPSVFARAGRGFSEHGLAWYFAQDPVLKEQTDQLGRTLGQAFRSLGVAIRNDMVKVAQEALKRP